MGTLIGPVVQKQMLDHMLVMVSHPPKDVKVKLMNADFDKYIMMRTVHSADYKLSKNHRLIFIGDIHGSYDPLE
jgi:hypothetical protein